MARVIVGTKQRIQSVPNNTKHLINQAITHSIIKADDALKGERYKDAHKFYKYALRLCEMQFGQQDSMVKNLRLLLKGIDEFLNQNKQRAQSIVEAG